MNGYQIEEYLGVGSFGAVVRASKGGETVAIKALMDTENPTSKLNLEISILSNLNHPCIPRFIESFSQGNVSYLVQEFIHGYPLSYYIVHGKRFEEAEVKQIISQLLTILVLLHEPPLGKSPIIHRDLRLSNLFWVNSQLYLIDFGLADYYSGNTLTPSILQPEGIEQKLRRKPGAATYNFLRKEISPRSDLFGTGVVALDLFTNWIEDEAIFQQPWQKNLPASRDFIDFLERLLTPETQFISAAEALNGLQLQDE
ncbi:MAG TPA: protein kinase [Candidatus Deferrimicrobium sp.]|nr:protein kinase [Candidatus Deferrimicrobium sp.]